MINKNIKISSFKILKSINIQIFFPFLKFLMDKPTNLTYTLNELLNFEVNHKINLYYLYDSDLVTIPIDNDCIFLYTSPKKDLFNRTIRYNFINKRIKKLILYYFQSRKYNLVPLLPYFKPKKFYRVVRLLRNENPILKEYLNSYMTLYADYSTSSRTLLYNSQFFLIMFAGFKKLIENLDNQYEKIYTRKYNILELDKAIASAIYLYYQDTRILAMRINAFNNRISGNSMSKKYKNPFISVSLTILAYGILRQKLRTQLTLIALQSIFNLKRKILKQK